MHQKAVIAGIKHDSHSLNDLEQKIYDFVLDYWPTFPLEIAEHFSEDTSTREHKKRASTKYTYHLKKLIEKKLILSKKSGNNMIVWPLLAEKYRVIHSILSD